MLCRQYTHRPHHPGAIKPARHPKRPIIKVPIPSTVALKDKKDLDSNKDAANWLVDEDWVLLQGVRLCLAASGAINWALVADYVNLSSWLPGRHRSRQQCKDRYFNAIMPVEEGKAAPPETKKPKRKNEKEGSVGAAAAAAALKGPRGKVVNTEKRCALDRRQSILALHSAFFKACISARQGEAKPTKARKSDTVGAASLAANVTMDKYLSAQSIPVLERPAPTEAARLSEQRIVRDRQREQVAKQAAAAAAAAAAAPTPTAAPPPPSPNTPSIGQPAVPGQVRPVSAGPGGVRPTTPQYSANPAAQAGSMYPVRIPPTAAPHTGSTRPPSRAHQMALFVLNNSGNQQQNAMVRAIYNDSNKSEAVKVIYVRGVLSFACTCICVCSAF